jgi:hypothetical protein
LGGHETGFCHERDCLVELPVALVKLNDGQLHQYALDAGQGIPSAEENLFFEALGVDFE